MIHRLVDIARAHDPQRPPTTTMLADLNVPWPAVPNPIALTNLSKTLVLLYDLGYTVVALNHTIDGTAKAPSGGSSKKNKGGGGQQVTAASTECPINFALLPSPPPKGLTVLTRGTLILDDSSASHQPQRVQAMGLVYDIVAVRPKSERTMLMACTSIDGVDIVSLDMTVRFPCFLKHRTVGAAVGRGVKFEISYAGGKDPSLEFADSGIKLTSTDSGGAAAATLHIGDGSGLSATSNPESRRHLVSNAAHIIRSSRSRAILVSSEAYSPVVCRGPYDVVNLATTWGLDHMRAREAIDKVAVAVIKAGQLRRTSYKQVIRLGQKRPSEVETPVNKKLKTNV